MFSFLVSELSCGVHAVLALGGEWGENSCVKRLDDEFVEFVDLIRCEFLVRLEVKLTATVQDSDCFLEKDLCVRIV